MSGDLRVYDGGYSGFLACGLGRGEKFSVGFSWVLNLRAEGFKWLKGSLS